ncbi:SCO7613 C-terminal domain-containing membrane protein [Blastococcus sp. SYSU D01042]
MDQQFARPPQVLLVVGAVLLVSAGIAVATTWDGPWARAAVLALAVVAAAASLVADEAELRSSAETFAASAAGLGLAASDVGSPPASGDPVLPLALAGAFLAVRRVSSTPAAWPLAAWASLQVAALRSLDAVPDTLRTELLLGVALLGLGVALWARPLVARLTALTTAPWFAAGVLGGSREAWTAGPAERWVATVLVAAAAAGLLLARLRPSLDVLLGPPRLVPVAAGALTAVAVTGACSAGGPVAVAVAGFAGVLGAALSAASLTGWRRGLLLPAALAGGVLLAALSVLRLLDGRHWSEIALLLLLTSAATAWVAARRRDDRPVAAPTAVGCLAGAALLGLPDGWGTPAQVAALLTTLYLLALLVAARLDRTSRRATATAAAACAAAAVVLPAVQGDGGLLAGHLAVQAAVTLGWGWWDGRGADDPVAAWRVGAAQLVAAAWLTAALADVGTVEAYSLPAALGLLLASGRGLLHDRSWTAWGPGLLVAAAPSALLVVATPDVLRAVLVMAFAGVVLVAGARAGLRAPLMVGAGTALVVGLGLAARALPWPVATALVVGAVLLAVGARRERRPVAGFAVRLADLR